MNEATETLDGDLRAIIASKLVPSFPIEYTDSPERTEVPTEPLNRPRGTLRHEPHWNATQTRVIWETIEDTLPAKEAPKEKPEPPKFNRAERRRLSRYIVRKARRQVRRVERKESRDIRELRGNRCARCHLLFQGRAKWRCQCKAVVAGKEKAHEQADLVSL